MLKVIKQKDGTYHVQSRSSDIFWIVSSDLTKCNCPKFIYILHGQGDCHHIESAKEFTREGEKNNLTKDITFNPDHYLAPISHDAFAREYGDDQLGKLIKLQIVILSRGIVRLLK